MIKANNPARTRASEVQADPATEPFFEKETTTKQSEKQLKIDAGVKIACIGSVQVKNLEFRSAMLSLLAFGGSIFLIIWAHTQDKPNYNPAFPLWWSDITIVDMEDSGKAAAVQSFGAAWEQMCSKNKALEVNGTQIQLQDNKLQIVPATRVIKDGFYPVLMLCWIFLISFVFQFSRSKDKYIALLFGFDPTAKVEYTRWLEYALTSPLQIWIVASLFFVGDIMTMTALAGAQLGLVLLGALIEYFNGRARKKAKKEKVNNIAPNKSTSAYRCAYVTWFLAWSIHLLIWVPLFWRFRHQIDKSDACVPASTKENWDEARFYVELTFYLELLLFSCFGWRLTYVTFFQGTGVDFDLSEEEQLRFGVNYSTTQGKLQRWKRRLEDSGIYALLSITAKVALDFGFLALIFVRAQDPALKTIHNAVNNAITGALSDPLADTVDSISSPGDSR